MLTRLIATAALAGLLGTAAAATPTIDPAGDFLATYTGPQAGDLDVRSIDVLRNSTDFMLNANLGAAIGTTAGAFYVWGIDRGQGTARFGALAPGVLFDSVLIIRPGGVSAFADLLNNANSFNLALGAVSFNGGLLSVVVPIASLPSTGFAPADYRFNLWPRATGPAGIAAISDFAPDNGTVAAGVPEPASWALLIGGFGVVGTALRRRRFASGEAHA